MKISQSISSTLLVAITEALQGGMITSYGTFSFEKDWESTTLGALDAEFAKSLSKALDGSTLLSFVRDQLTLLRVLGATPLPKDDAPITKLKCFSDPLKTARHIVSALEAVPNQYRLIVRVAVELGERVNSEAINIGLSERLTLLSGAMISPTFKTHHEVPSVDTVIRRMVMKEDDLSIIPNALYLEYRTSGYLAARRQSRAISEFYDQVRAFYGACIAYNIISEYGTWGDEITPFLLGDSISNGLEEFAYVERAEDDVVNCANLATSDKTDQAIKAETSLEKILEPVRPVFKSDNSLKLKTACAWALRAHLSNRGLDKILESAITIEVLMGDRDTSDRVGLSKLIANRCAYALGDSNKSRSDMIDFFVKFYRVRSEVVHSGRTALEPDERRIVNEGLTLATRILKHEISLAR
ncbi:HEPN domain-containing protein [Sphingomonas sp. HF-S4]|uniref:HEPN domain-containing protein n=1 Tax=Sphingomonas agrestis TaxID=3080540 RepID=A0ABU3Y202_9SPHN|nr:HEPN domain-containing protein [Sphingomonas sp. HF-S4]MDV3455410.1 HEPN domain-containing protein [Sphingomonas sp. HF-S4]